MKFSQEAQAHLPGQKGNGPTQRAQSLSTYQTSGSNPQNRKETSQNSVLTPAQRKANNGQSNNGSGSNAGKHTGAISNTSSNGSRKSHASNQGQVLKQVKINKPTFNLQINNNVGNVNNSDGGAITMITKNNASQHQQQPQ